MADTKEFVVTAIACWVVAFIVVFSAVVNIVLATVISLFPAVVILTAFGMNLRRILRERYVVSGDKVEIWYLEALKERIEIADINSVRVYAGRGLALRVGDSARRVYLHTGRQTGEVASLINKLRCP